MPPRILSAMLESCRQPVSIIASRQSLFTIQALTPIFDARLIAYLQDARLRLDNNLVENAIRPFVVGRKNWLFSGHPRGAVASAFLYSLIKTAKANGLKPYAYLRHLFDQLPLAKTEDDYRNLLPPYMPPA